MNAEAAENLVAILFADVVGSTHLYEAMGDDKARETVQECLDVMKQATEKYGGTVIKTMGDEVMSTFPSADDAMNAGTRMQQRITNNQDIGSDNINVAIRIGCHYGPVTIQDRDIFGAAVHTANRMTSQAKAGQILTTSATVDQLSGEWKALVRQIDLATVKGRSGQVEVFEVLWQPEEATSMLPAIGWGKAKPSKLGTLVLKFQGLEIVVDQNSNQIITLGRADDNDVVIKGNLISRIHARIEVSKDRFILIDESTNGTFLQRNDGEEVFVRRDEIELVDGGILSLGRVAPRGTSLAIEYTCER